MTPADQARAMGDYIRESALDAMTAERDALADLCLISRRERDSAREALAKVQKDAGRYRWLRDGRRSPGDWNVAAHYAEESLDGVIDAAIAAQPETKT